MRRSVRFGSGCADLPAIAGNVVFTPDGNSLISPVGNRVTVFNQGSILVEDTMENVLKNQEVRDIYLGKREVA